MPKVTVTRAAEMLNCSRSQIFKLIKSGELTAEPIDSSIKNSPLLVEGVEKLTPWETGTLRAKTGTCETCKFRHTRDCPWTNETVASTGQQVGVCNKWEMRNEQS